MSVEKKQVLEQGKYLETVHVCTKGWLEEKSIIVHEKKNPNVRLMTTAAPTIEATYWISSWEEETIQKWHFLINKFPNTADIEPDYQKCTFA